MVGYIDAWRYPATAPVRWADGSVRDGFVIVEPEDVTLGPVAARYRLGGSDLYLVCLGAACTRAPAAAQ